MNNETYISYQPNKKLVVHCLFNLILLFSMCTIIISLWFYLFLPINNLEELMSFLFSKAVFRIGGIGIPKTLVIPLGTYLLQIMIYLGYRKFQIYQKSQLIPLSVIFNRLFNTVFFISLIPTMIFFHDIIVQEYIPQTVIPLFDSIKYIFIVLLWYEVCNLFVVFISPMFSVNTKKLPFKFYICQQQDIVFPLLLLIVTAQIPLFLLSPSTEISNQLYGVLLPIMLLFLFLIIFNIVMITGRQSLNNYALRQLQKDIDDITGNKFETSVSGSQFDKITDELNNILKHISKYLDEHKRAIKESLMMYSDVFRSHEQLQEALDSQLENLYVLKTAVDSLDQGTQDAIAFFHNHYGDFNQNIEKINELSTDIQEIINITYNIKQFLQNNHGHLLTASQKLKQSSLTGKNILDNMHTIGEEIRNAGMEAEYIDEILLLVQDIAEQTNILAINAALEAAHAGDSGKGFAIISNEVHILANVSSEAVDKISRKLINMRTIIKDATEIVTTTEEIAGENNIQINNAYQDIGQVVSHVKNLKNLTIRAYHTSSDQKSHTSQVNRKLNTLSEFMKQLQSTLQHQDNHYKKLTNLIQTFPDYLEGLGNTSNRLNHNVDRLMQWNKEIYGEKNLKFNEETSKVLSEKDENINTSL